MRVQVGVSFLLAAVLVLSVAAVVGSPAQAQCAIPKAFASIGNVKTGYTQVSVDSSRATPLGDEIGRFWDPANAANANNFGGTCSPSLWWTLDKSGEFAISGTLTGGTCLQTGCPGEELVVLVEDWSAGHPAPGVNSDAYFVLWRVDETPANARWYDYGRTADGDAVFEFFPYPIVQVTSSAVYPGGPGGLFCEMSYNLADVARNFHGANGDTAPPGVPGDPIPPEDTIVSYDVMRAIVPLNAPEPGRLRSSWTQVAVVPYRGHGVSGELLAMPALKFQDVYLAVGLSFDGGAAGPIPSALVGRAIGRVCEPILAEPHVPTERLQKPVRRPSVRR